MLRLVLIRLEAQIKKGGTDASRSEVLLRDQGYILSVKPSRIEGAGRGVFLTKGAAKAGDVSFCMSAAKVHGERAVPNSGRAIHFFPQPHNFSVSLG